MIHKIDKFAAGMNHAMLTTKPENKEIYVGDIEYIEQNGKTTIAVMDDGTRHEIWGPLDLENCPF